LSDIDDLISTKELASKLKVTEPLLKKLINDFAIETQRVDRRAHLNSKAATTVKEILALRASGKKNSEIKEMFESSKQASPKANNNKKPEKQEPTIEETKENSKDSEKKPAEKETKKPELVKKKPKKPLKKKEAPIKNQDTKSNDSKLKEATNKEELKKTSSIEQVNHKDSNSTKQEEPEEAGIMDISGYLLEDQAESSELKSLLNDDDDENENADFSEIDEVDDIEEVDEIEESRDKTISQRKIRRRQFSFKYIQRQIANDSKRINYIKQKLQRGRLSTKEAMMLEDSLHHRSILLSGWIQLLRWVKN
jgi:hypothetical protein